MAEPALAGTRVVELGQVIAGPSCGQLLGDLGTEVIEVEPPGAGDVLRQWGRVHDADGDSLWWRVTGRDERSVTVDLRRPEGQDPHEAGVPAGLVHEPEDVCADPHSQARGSIVRVPDDEFGEVAMPAVVPRLSGTPGGVRGPAPRLGQDTDAVLTELLGLGPPEIHELRVAGVV